MDGKPLNRKQHERLSALYLVTLYSTYSESISIGKVDGESKSGQLATDIEQLLHNYFFDRRESVPLRRAERSLAYSEVIGIVEDALFMIAKENPDLIDIDWSGKFRMKGTKGN
jgi:hypothetical protein